MKYKLKNIILIILLIIIFICFFSGCNLQKSNENIDKIKQSGKIIMGTSADFFPYEYKNPTADKNKDISGLDVSIGEEIAKSLGVKLEIKNMKFEDLYASLQNGSIDMILSAATPSPDKYNNFSFSKIYYKSSSSIVINKTDVDDYSDLKDFKHSLIGVQDDTLQSEMCQSQMKKSKLNYFSKSYDIIDALKNNKIDAAVLESPIANEYVSKDNTLAISTASFWVDSNEKGNAIVVRKNSIDLLDNINKSLDVIINSGRINEYLIKAFDDIK